MSADAVSASFQADAEWLVAALERYRTESETKAAPVTQLPALADLVEHLDLDRYPREGGLAGAAFQSFTPAISTPPPACITPPTSATRWPSRTAPDRWPL